MGFFFTVQTPTCAQSFHFTDTADLGCTAGFKRQIFDFIVGYNPKIVDQHAEDMSRYVFVLRNFQQATYTAELAFPKILFYGLF